MKKKIIITGVSGFIGKIFFNKIKNKFNVYGIYNSTKINENKTKKIDLSNLIETKNFIKKIKPDVIFHFAAMTNPKLNELDKKKSYKSNFIVTKNIVKCANKKTKIVFLSTDKVYDGNYRKNSEKDIPKPLNFYGRQKLNSENFIKKNIDKFYILRLPIVHSNGRVKKKSIIDKFIYEINKNKKINIFSNVVRSFIKINELNDFMIKLIDMDKNYGIYNIGSKPYSYLNRVFLLSTINEKKFRKLVEGNLGKVFPLKQPIDVSKVKKFFNISFS
jgi:dTDP-4-dehydrorhamnose reductase